MKKDYTNLFWIRNGMIAPVLPLSPDDKWDALEASIKKWEFQKEFPDTPPSDAGSTCGLCVLFLSQRCNGCPVFEKSGFRFCNGTPLTSVKIGNAKSIQAELDFLKSLRPAWLRSLLGDEAEEVEPVGEDYGEPLSASKSDSKHIADSIGRHVAFLSSGLENATERTRYRDRIIACVNACEGISNDDLGRGVVVKEYKFPGLKADITTLNPTVQDVCDLLEMLDDKFEYAEIRFKGDGSGRLWPNGYAEKQLLCFADTAQMMRKLREYAEARDV